MSDELSAFQRSGELREWIVQSLKKEVPYLSPAPMTMVDMVLLFENVPAVVFDYGSGRIEIDLTSLPVGGASEKNIALQQLLKRPPTGFSISSDVVEKPVLVYGDGQTRTVRDLWNGGEPLHPMWLGDMLAHCVRAVLWVSHRPIAVLWMAHRNSTDSDISEAHLTDDIEAFVDVSCPQCNQHVVSVTSYDPRSQIMRVGNFGPGVDESYEFPEFHGYRYPKYGVLICRCGFLIDVSPQIFEPDTAEPRRPGLPGRVTVQQLEIFLDRQEWKEAHRKP